MSRQSHLSPLGYGVNGERAGLLIQSSRFESWCPSERLCSSAVEHRPDKTVAGGSIPSIATRSFVSRLKSVGNSRCIRSSKEERRPVTAEVGISKLLVCAVAVAEWLLRQIVDLIFAGSNPVGHPRRVGKWLQAVLKTVAGNTVLSSILGRAAKESESYRVRLALLKQRIGNDWDSSSPLSAAL